jgi:hypothetical protein
VIRVNDGDLDSCSSSSSTAVAAVATVVFGASYSTSVGKPNAVINADETIGEAYKLGGGSLLLLSSSVEEAFEELRRFFGLLNVE